MSDAISNLHLIAPPVAIWIFLIVGLFLLTVSHRIADKKYFSRAVLLTSVALFIMFSLYFYRFTVDDVYISLTYARNLANGSGMVHSADGSNLVEGYTNFLWVILETPLFLLDLPDSIVIHCVKLIGLAFGVGVVFLTYRLTHLLTLSKRAALIAAFLLSVVPYFSFWAIGGLETPMYMFWLMAGLQAFIKEDRRNRMHIGSMIFFSLMALTRPEGFLLGLAILILECITAIKCRITKETTGFSDRMKKIAPGAAIFVLIYGAYFLWRYNFYGYLLPNTFYAKTGPLGIQHLVGRLNGMRAFLVYLLPIVSLACFAYSQVPKDRANEKRLISVVIVILFAFSFATKGEWMPGFRYELPFVPLLVAFFALAIDKLLPNSKRKAAISSPALVAMFGLLFFMTMFLLHPGIELRREKQYGDALDRAHIAFGKWLGKYAPKNASFAGWDMGAIPYYSQFSRIIEIHPVGLLSSYICHKGYDLEYFLSQKPSFIVLPPKPKQTFIDVKENVNYAILRFYSNELFLQNYQRIFSFAFARDYIMDIYKHNDIFVPPHALDEGNALADRSFREARKVPRGWGRSRI